MSTDFLLHRKAALKCTHRGKSSRTGTVTTCFYRSCLWNILVRWFETTIFTYDTRTGHLRHNERVGVSNHRRPYVLLNCLFRRRSNKTSASLAFVRGIHRSLVNSPHKGPAMPIWWRNHCEPCFYDFAGTFSLQLFISLVFCLVS